MINPSNGEADPSFTDLDTDTKLDTLIEAVTTLVDQIETLREEMAEKFANISTPGIDYGVEDLDN